MGLSEKDALCKRARNEERWKGLSCNVSIDSHMGKEMNTKVQWMMATIHHGMECGQH